MTPEARLARATRAEAALTEFVAPEFATIRQAYLDRIVEVSTKELDSKVRADKLTCLSTALRIMDQVEAAVRNIVMDGSAANKIIDNRDRVERMSAPQRRLLNIFGN